MYIRTTQIHACYKTLHKNARVRLHETRGEVGVGPLDLSILSHAHVYMYIRTTPYPTTHIQLCKVHKDPSFLHMDVKVKHLTCMENKPVIVLYFLPLWIISKGNYQGDLLIVQGIFPSIPECAFIWNSPMHIIEVLTDRLYHLPSLQRNDLTCCHIIIPSTIHSTIFMPY